MVLLIYTSYIVLKCLLQVTITPEVPKSINRCIIRQLVKLYKDSNLGSKTPAYDGMKSLFTAGPLPFAAKEFTVELDEKDGRSSSNRYGRSDVA